MIHLMQQVIIQYVGVPFTVVDLCRDGGAGCTACDAENPSMFFVCSQYGDYSITEKRQCGDNCLCEKTADCVVDCLPGSSS